MVNLEGKFRQLDSNSNIEIKTGGLIGWDYVQELPARHASLSNQLVSVELLSDHWLAVDLR